MTATTRYDGRRRLALLLASLFVVVSVVSSGHWHHRVVAVKPVHASAAARYTHGAIQPQPDTDCALCQFNIHAVSLAPQPVTFVLAAGTAALLFSSVPVPSRRSAVHDGGRSPPLRFI